MAIESTYLENDRFGYSCYVVALPASDELTKQLSVIEKEAGQTRAKIPSHITVKGTFYEPVSLTDVLESVDRVAAAFGRIILPSAGNEVYGTEKSAGFRFIPTDDIQSLHDQLVAAIEPVSKSAYVDDPFRCHISIVDTVRLSGVERAVELGRQIVLPEALEFPFLDTYGRDGNATDGAWKRLSRIELAKNQ